MALAWDFFKKRGTGPRAAVAVAIAVFAVAGWAMTREFKAVTGHAFTLPYQVNQKTYGWPMTLAWLPAKKIDYSHPEFDLYRQWELKEHEYLVQPSKAPAGVLIKYAYWWRFFFGVGLSATFLFAGRILRLRKLRTVWIAAAVVALMVLTEQTGYPHYLAAAAPAMMLFAVMGLRYLAQSRSIFGIAMVRLVVPIWLVVLSVQAAEFSKPAARPNYPSWCCTDARSHDREPLLEKIAAAPGNHLVIVTYNLASYDTFDWVYNEPDIDAAKVIFARDMGADKNRELLAYYPERRVWRIVIGEYGAVLK
jgi:hypothetical protein